MPKKNISIIVVIDENYGIGKDNKLLCHLSDDLKRFKKITGWHKVVMGKNTYFSLPKRPLPNRINIVLTDDMNDRFEGCAMAYSIEDVLNFCGKDETFIIGGASVYKQFFPHANRLYVTRIHHSFEADTFFPKIRRSKWELLKKEKHAKDIKHDFDFTFMNFKRK